MQKDIYNTELVEKYIELCDKYQMKLEILWFGSYMCGYSVEGYIPEYIVNDPVTYPDLKPDAAFDGWLGKHYYLKPNTPALVALISGITILDGVTRLRRIPARLKIPILTLAASALIQSPNGTKLKNRIRNKSIAKRAINIVGSISVFSYSPCKGKYFSAGIRADGY